MPQKDEDEEGTPGHIPQSTGSLAHDLPRPPVWPGSHFTRCCAWRSHSRCGRNRSLDPPSPCPPLPVPHRCLLPCDSSTRPRPGNHGVWTDGSHARIAPREGPLVIKSLFCLPSVWGRVPTVGAAATPSPSVPRGPGPGTHRHCPALVLATPSWVFFNGFRNHVIRLLDLMSKMFTNHMCFETQMAHFHPENPTSWASDERFRGLEMPISKSMSMT